MRIVAVLNRDGGTLRTMDLSAFAEKTKSIFDQHAHQVRVEIVAGEDIEATLKTSFEDPNIEAVMVGGGDGTISTAAAISFKTGKPLAVLPAGTMNLFARSLKVPLELEEALEALACGYVGSVDIATVNGRPFVHQYGVGVHARLIRIREGMTYRGRFGKMIASLKAITAAAIEPPRFQAELDTSNGKIAMQITGLSVTNNPLSAGHMPFAERLDRGLLGVYVAKPMTTSALLRLAVDVLIGSWRDSPMVSEQEVAAVTLRFPKRKQNSSAVVDGELIKLAEKVEIKVHPGALKVILPSLEHSAAEQGKA